MRLNPYDRRANLIRNAYSPYCAPRSPTAPTDTPRRVPLVHICPEQSLGDCAYWHFHFFWWVGLDTNHPVLTRRKYQYRLPCVFTYHLRGDTVGGPWSQGFDSFQNHCRGCDALLHDYICLSFRGRDDPESRAGGCDRSSVCIWLVTSYV